MHLNYPIDTWGIRRRFETGKHKMSTKRFLGYDTDENGKSNIGLIRKGNRNSRG